MLSEEESAALTARRDSLNGIELYRKICSRLRRIKNWQEKWKSEQRARKETIDAVRLANCIDGGVDLRPKGGCVQKRKQRSVELLMSQKLRRVSAGALSI